MILRNELKNHLLEQHNFRARLSLLGLLTIACFALLGARFYFLQIAKYNHYQTLAENNRISLVPIVPNRGIITDRNGVVLAHNFFVYTLEITPSKIANANDTNSLDKTIDEISKLIEISSQDRKQFNKILAQSREFESVPLRTHLNEVEAARFAVNHYRFPGVEIRSRLYRHYPQGKLGAHMIGYIGRINDKDISKLEETENSSNYKGSDHIGKDGLEKYYEKQLHGTTGFQQIEIDADGHAVRVLSSTPPIPGSDLILSIDSKMQEIAENAFADKRGALVAINPKNGEVLAFVSQPGFDPNLFVDGIDSENWNLLNDSLDKPLVNRVVRGVYPPGSTFKPFVALAGLESGLRQPPFNIYDVGSFKLNSIPPHTYRDWAPNGHGHVDIRKAIAVSCDTFFYGLAMELGIDKMTDYVRHFNFGKKTNIDINGEIDGLLPTPEWKKRRFKKAWFPGETVITGIGQGYTLVTPMQLAQATAVLANRGVAIMPHLVKSIMDVKSGTTKNVPIVIQDRATISDTNFEIVNQGMVSVTRPGGTAPKVGAGASYSIAAKTGTAQVVGMKKNEKYNANAMQERHRDHGLFIAYAPADNPKIALAIIVENAGHGGTVAGPIARRVMDYYLLGKVPPTPNIANNPSTSGDATINTLSPIPVREELND